ncbi:hypothetical protein [Streptomyces sp. 35G-GA-8]|uniref:hypothetical protein n=1 Tax=Streptomyces sp. 35G-GA-8 TaxID=2939434 RepID=UPI00201EF3C8|nr:hypothetical protein [Streptomyces sp. 35G-GA-8]MCL7377450.1 hypothetical protein [Streptomyces sp. 35G-GA-8]
MSEAIYGLLGALGGALVTSAAAFWGPLQIQRRAREETEQRAEQERTASAVRRDAERVEAAAREAQTRREAEINRIIGVRATFRDWSDLLARAIQDLELGRSLSIDDFDIAVASAQNDAQAALDHVLHDGAWIPQSNYGFPLRPTDPTLEGQRLRVLTAALKHATSLVRAAVIPGRPFSEAEAEDLRRTLEQADAARGALSTALLNRLEEAMRVTVIDQTAATASPSAAAFVRPDAVPSLRSGHEDTDDFARDPLTGLTLLEVRANQRLAGAQSALEDGYSLAAFDNADSAVRMYERLERRTGRSGRLSEARDVRRIANERRGFDPLRDLDERSTLTNGTTPEAER